MRKVALIALAIAGTVAAIAAAATRGPAPEAGNASSHREAPLISEDPTADNTDVYAFRAADAPDQLTVISNWLPAEDPAAGPIYYRFSSTARYYIYLDTNGDARPDITYRVSFRNKPGPLFLGNTVQDYNVERVQGGRTTIVGRGTTPPNNIGPRTLQAGFGTTNYREIAAKGVFSLEGGGKVFAGQREDAFFGDIGAIFDLLGFRRGTGITGGGKDFFAGYAVHAIALQVPIAGLNARNNIVGVWSSTERQRVTIRNVSRKLKSVVVQNGKRRTVTRTVKSAVASKSFVQVSRIGNPLFNELIIPTEMKDGWNASQPAGDSRYAQFVQAPILAKAINQLYPGVIDAPEQNRADLVQVLLTGVSTPQLNFTGPTQADMLRLNLSIAPTAAAQVNRLGVLGGDLAGYPNGRRLEDDVIDISERAVAGALMMNPKANLLGDGVDANNVTNLGFFPYEGDPPSGFDNTKGEQKP